MMGTLGMGFGVLGPLLMVLLWAGLIALAFWVVRSLFPSAGGQQTSSSNRDLNARQILDRRYARGEISREEYELMRDTIAGGIS